MILRCDEHSWGKLKSRFEIYLQATGSTTQPCAQKVGLLLNHIGDAGIKIFTNFTFNEVDDKNYFVNVVAKSDAYFTKRVPQLMLREKLWFHLRHELWRPWSTVGSGKPAYAAVTRASQRGARLQHQQADGACQLLRGDVHRPTPSQWPRQSGRGSDGWALTKELLALCSAALSREDAVLRRYCHQQSPTSVSPLSTR